MAGRRISLTDRQKKLIDYYIQTGEKKKAAIMAGFSEKTALSGHVWKSRLVKEEIEKIMEQERNERIMKANEVLERLTSIARTEQKEEICLMSRNKIERTRKDPSIKDQVKALETLAKIIGLYSDNSNVNVNTQNNITIVDDI